MLLWAALVASLAACVQGSQGVCTVPGCWSNPDEGVLLEIRNDLSSAQSNWGIENTSDIGNLSCTSRCSDRCYPGSFPYSPCTGTHDLGCAWPGQAFPVPAPGGLLSPVWPIVVGVDTIFFGDRNTIYTTTGSLVAGGSLLGASVVAGSPYDAGGFADGPTHLARFNQVGGIDHRNGSLYVCDTGNSAVRVVMLDDGTVSTLLGGPNSVVSGDLVSPVDLSWGPDGMVYIIDPSLHVIYRFAVGVEGASLEVFGGVRGESGIGNGPLSIVRFWELSSISVVGSRVLVTEYSQCTLRSIDIESRVVKTVAGDSNVCDPVCNGGSGPPVDGQGDLSRLCRPAVVRRWGRTDLVYVGESFNGFKNVRSINTTSAVVSSLQGDGWRRSPLAFATGLDQQFVFRSDHGLGENTTMTYVEPLPCDPSLVVDDQSLFDCRVNLTTADLCPGEVVPNYCPEGCFGMTCQDTCTPTCSVEGEHILRHCDMGYRDTLCGTVRDAVVVGPSEMLSEEFGVTGRVFSPRGMAYVNVSEAYITDTSNQRILRFNPAKNQLWMFSGVSEVPQFLDGARWVWMAPVACEPCVLALPSRSQK